jgi:hypothetical protein
MTTLLCQELCKLSHFSHFYYFLPFTSNNTKHKTYITPYDASQDESGFVELQVWRTWHI